MKTSDSIKNLLPALFAAQKKMGPALKNANNPYFKSKYADLGAVLDVCEEHLNNNNIMILQPNVFSEHEVTFSETMLIHVPSGEWISSQTKILTTKDDPQVQGSAITYARRYGLQALLSIPSADDDGNLASGKSIETKTTPKSTAPQVSVPVATATKGFGAFKAAKKTTHPIIDQEKLNNLSPVMTMSEVNKLSTGDDL